MLPAALEEYPRRKVVAANGGGGLKQLARARPIAACVSSPIRISVP
jgi:hypothetical protein